MATLIRTLTDHSDDVNCCAFSSSCLATCSLDKSIRVYSLNDFTELPYSPLKGHAYAVHCCCFSPSGQTLASCSTDGTTIVWDARDGRMLAVLEQPTGSPVRVCRFSPESSYLVSGAADGSVVLWNMHSMKMYRWVPNAFSQPYLLLWKYNLLQVLLCWYAVLCTGLQTLHFWFMWQKEWNRVRTIKRSLRGEVLSFCFSLTLSSAYLRSSIILTLILILCLSIDLVKIQISVFTDFFLFVCFTFKMYPAIEF